MPVAHIYILTIYMWAHGTPEKSRARVLAFRRIFVYELNINYSGGP